MKRHLLKWARLKYLYPRKNSVREPLFQRVVKRRRRTKMGTKGRKNTKKPKQTKEQKEAKQKK